MSATVGAIVEFYPFQSAPPPPPLWVFEPLPLPDPVAPPEPLAAPEPLPVVDPLPDLVDVPLFLVLSSVEVVPVPAVPLDPDVVVPVVPVAEPLPLVVLPVCPPDVVLLLLVSEQPQVPSPMAPDKMAAVSRYRSFLILPPLR